MIYKEFKLSNITQKVKNKNKTKEERKIKVIIFQENENEKENLTSLILYENEEKICFTLINKTIQVLFKYFILFF